jgi:hypothetical protein
MSYTNTTRRVKIVKLNEAKLKELDNVAFELPLTVGTWGGGDVLSFDDSAAGYVIVYNQAGTTNDLHIAGIGLMCTRDWLKPQHAAYGVAPLNGVDVSIIRYALADVRLANDNVAIAIGDVIAAEADSQTIEEVATQAVGAVDKMAWEEITVTNPTQNRYYELGSTTVLTNRYCVGSTGPKHC